jgi:hypothetical protein
MQVRYGSLPHRVLIINGAHDRVSRLPWARRLESQVADARLVVVNRAGHMPMLTQPTKVLRALEPFLVGLEPGQALPARDAGHGGAGEPRGEVPSRPERAPAAPKTPASGPSTTPMTREAEPLTTPMTGEE